MLVVIFENIMFRRIYNWILEFSEHPNALWVLALVAFSESFFFPIPPDALLLPMIIANPQKAWKYALVTTLASVLGGIFGYVIGAFAFESIANPILISAGKMAAMENFSAEFNALGSWVILSAGISPIPFKVVTIMSGATYLPFNTFVLTCFIARGIRFFAVAALLKFFGSSIRSFIEKYLPWVFLTGILILILGVFGVGK